MNGDPKEDGAPEGEAASGRGQIAELLLRDGVLSISELRHAERVKARLAVPKPLVPLLLELGLLEPDRLRATLQRHRLELRIGALLVELGHLPEASLENALALQRRTEESDRKLGEILVTLGILGERELADVLSSQLGVPYVAGSELEPPPALLERAPLDVCRRHRFLPLREEGARVVVAFADPLDKEDAAAARSFLGAEVAPRIAAPSALEEALSRLDLCDRVLHEPGAGERAVTRAIAEMLEAAIREGASHVHVEPCEKRVRVRLRRDGVLHGWRELPASLTRPLLQRIAREAGVAAEEGAPFREGLWRREVDGRRLLLRASFFSNAGVESVTLALPDGVSAPLPVKALGLLPAMRRRLEEGPLAAPGSVLFVAGPPGSGRRTTLRAFAALQAHPSTRVIGLDEDAPGPLVTSKIAAALRQDPDVLVLGLLRQPAAVAEALRAARSGARVLAALEAEDAVAGLFAVAQAARGEGLLLPSLTAVLAQRLLRRVCDACAQAVAPSAAELRRLGCTPVDVAGGGFRRGRGCGRCGDLGVAGRIGVFELHALDEQGRDHVLAGGDAAAIRRGAAQVGPATLVEDGLLKAARGIVPVEELVRGLPRSAGPRALAELERLEEGTA